MDGRKLMDRVRGWGQPSSYPPDTRLASVILHLQKLLNARQGTTLMDAGYGMPDFTDLTAQFPDSVRDMERSISETIEKYEPRLSSVKVDFLFQDDRNLSLLFQIKAFLESGDERLPVQLESLVDTGGKLEIKR